MQNIEVLTLGELIQRFLINMDKLICDFFIILAILIYKFLKKLYIK